MKKEELLVTRLKDYGKSEVVPCHMPGHKRNMGSWLTGNFPNPFSIDITEIDGFDNLHHPEGILKNSMEWAARVYGSDKTWYLVNGSSCGILSSICGTVRPGGQILMSRNCHKSAYHGVILTGADVHYVYPQIINEMGIQGGIRPEDVEKKLDRYPDISAVLIVSPTYDGIVSDVGRIAEIVHKRGIPLIVDEAHGAHFSFGPGIFPKSAITQGADLVIQSVHKTLPSFTQTAVLHGKKGLIDLERVEKYLQMFQTSSPSYIFMAGIEQCIYEMSKNGMEYMKGFETRLFSLRASLGKLKNLRILKKEENMDSGVYDMDLSKLVISCRGCKKGSDTHFLSGEDLGNWLRQDYHIEMEMCGADYVVAILTYMDQDKDLKRLEQGLLEIDAQLESSGENFDWNENFKQSEAIILKKPAEASESKVESILFEECEGRISAEFIYLYPPGIPITAPGELVTKKIISQVKGYLDMKFPVQGMADPECRYLKVLQEQGKDSI